MANVVVKKIPCPKCSETTEAKLYMSINATNEPTLREDVLDEKLFRFRCTACGHEARLTYPVLYNDMKNRFMIYMIPEIDRFQLEDVELEQKYERLHGVRKRLAPDFNSFKEKVFIFESGLDDMAVEITKLVISEMVAKKYGIPQVEEGYLSMYDREKNTMGFTFFVGKRKEPYVQSARLEIYGKAVTIVSEMAIKDKKLTGFTKIDREWAQNVLYRYKRMKQLDRTAEES
ncbi:MAG: CpXC domain-containing protein [Clostridia bacterium]|nr:CpXC domain-containing protein [Clostridia bacterium]